MISGQSQVSNGQGLPTPCLQFLIDTISGHDRSTSTLEKFIKVKHCSVYVTFMGLTELLAITYTAVNLYYFTGHKIQDAQMSVL